MAMVVCVVTKDCGKVLNIKVAIYSEGLKC
jgi:hypothetical protein